MYDVLKCAWFLMACKISANILYRQGSYVSFFIRNLAPRSGWTKKSHVARPKGKIYWPSDFVLTSSSWDVRVDSSHHPGSCFKKRATKQSHWVEVGTCKQFFSDHGSEYIVVLAVVLFNIDVRIGKGLLLLLLLLLLFFFVFGSWDRMTSRDALLVWLWI